MLIARRWFAGLLLAGFATAATATATPAQALDKVRVASAQRGLWTTTLVEFGDRKGLFKDAGIELDIVWTDGGSDAQQAVITGSIDVAVATGTLGVVAAWAKGAPIAIIGADFIGGTDLFWYVKKASPIRTAKDLGGKTVGYSRPGASSHLMAQAVLEANGVQAKLVPSGGPAASLTAVMTDQIDVGWSAPPTSIEQIRAGDIRILFNGSDAPGLAEQTVRVHIANTQFLAAKPDVAKRFMAALRKTIDWAYDTDEAIAMWAEMHKTSLDIAREARDVGYPRASLKLKPLIGMREIGQQALDTKRITRPLTPEQLVDIGRYVDQLNPT